MKYYLIAGEASGDLHASNLMRALRDRDPEAQFRFYGGDLMAAVGGELVTHYRDLAYMGFLQVALHSRTILRNMSRCKQDILRWAPDALILVDYPGFNLSVAKFVHANSHIPVYYYISPKIWAWKTWRIKAIRRDIDEVFSILPFEIPFYASHDYAIRYVGNPSVDSVGAYRRHAVGRADFLAANALPDKPLLAILAGSRKAEIRDNLPMMLKAAAAYPDCQPVIAGAPGLDEAFYHDVLSRYLPAKGGSEVRIVFGQTYPLLDHAHVAMVTSGTASLETALFRVPQVVCYYMRCGKVLSLVRRLVLKVPYISLVNLIADSDVVTELVADGMRVKNVKSELDKIIHDPPERDAMLNGYERVIQALGPEGASEHTAEQIISLLHTPTASR